MATGLDRDIGGPPTIAIDTSVVIEKSGERHLLFCRKADKNPASSCPMDSKQQWEVQAHLGLVYTPWEAIMSVCPRQQ